MATIILCVLILGIVFIVSDWDVCYGFWDTLFTSILNFLLGSLFGLLLGFLVALILPENNEMVTHTSKLEALQDNNSMSGSFFLGCGSVDGKMKYVYYYESDGGYKMNQIDCDDVVIKYSNESPRVERICNEPVKGKFINYFAIDLNQSHYIIYVPKGTIKQNYNLDAQ